MQSTYLGGALAGKTKTKDCSGPNSAAEQVFTLIEFEFVLKTPGNVCNSLPQLVGVFAMLPSSPKRHIR